ncbi:hypothetical protein KI387_009783 [Taxus chinensis]|uniref:Reverse transcriptase zinc-binding domain-containing protein n=1 Tax=Taxus chinensis TaxID=29808 RepID=A0AA38FJX3_TAXCH|nr:hypothetical protein KI387_009783 [Taxus chinensis]
MNEALIAKMGWRMLTEKQPWIDLIKEKYLKHQSLYSFLLDEQLPYGSIFWNNLVKSRNFIRLGSKWKVGDGRDINFWEDNWFNGNLMESFGMAKDSLINKYGIKIKDYIEENGTRKKWKKLFVDRIDLKQITSSLQDHLELIPLSQMDSKDELVWINSNDGNYTVKTGYNNFFHYNQTEFNWNRIWMTDLTPKIKNFLWLAIRGRILTNDNLMRRGLIIPNRCHICKKDFEDISHLFIHCEYATRLWSFSLSKFEALWVMSKDLNQLWTQWNPPFKHCVVKRIWKLVIPHLIWRIWKDRNDIIFRNRKQNYKLSIGKISNGIKENIAGSKPPKKKRYLENEEYILSNWQIGSINSWNIPRNSIDRSLIKWHPPYLNWYKLNFDGASEGNPGNVAGGGVIWDHKGNIIAVYVGKIGIQTNHFVEDLAAL